MRNLGEFRKAKGWSQKKLADQSGVSQTYISELEAAKKQPTVLIAQKLATAFGISLADLLHDEFRAPKCKEVKEINSGTREECVGIDDSIASIYSIAKKKS